MGLASATAGSVRLGRIPIAGFQQAVRFNPFGDSAVLSPFLLHNYLPSPSQSLMASDGFLDSGWSDSVAYTSPSFADVAASAQYAAREDSGAGRRLGLGAIYGAPASTFSLGVSYEKTGGAAATFPRRNPVSDPAAGVVTLRDFTSSTVGASDDFGAVRLFGQYRHARLEGTGGKVRLETAQLGAAVPLGAGKVLASVARTEKTEASSQDQNAPRSRSATTTACRNARTCMWRPCSTRPPAWTAARRWPWASATGSDRAAVAAVAAAGALSPARPPPGSAPASARAPHAW
ncbi:porin, partial [Paracidovorax cattleyae]